MSYIHDWEEFKAAAEKMYRTAPKTTRYVTKYSHKDNQVILKVTNNEHVLKYKTKKQNDLPKIQELNSLFVRLMTTDTKK
mmetsp:Transcript_21590/g.24098  ORF Transcript_21590/g.24098 Transcript_21590/m.24098 type:complete len:80 (+) Transcript_21590:8-247(+)